jgi:hypothetical protein
MKGFTRAEIAAIEYIGSHRKSDVKVGTGKPISTRTFNSLAKKRLVMWISEDKKTVMLTANGERVWTQLHPNSKYRIG